MEEIIDFFRHVSPAFALMLVAAALVLWSIYKAPLVPDNDEGDSGEVESPEQLYRKVIYKHDSPYHLAISNNSKERKSAVLYGHNINVMTPNFGSEQGIEIKSYQHVSYQFMLSNSANKEFTIRKFRIQGNEEHLKSLIIRITSIDPNGQICQIPLVVNSYIKENQIQKGIADVEYPCRIDGNTSLDFSVEPESQLSVSLFYNTEKFVKADDVCFDEDGEFCEKYNSYKSMIKDIPNA